MSQTPKIWRVVIACFVLGVLTVSFLWFINNSSKSQFVNVKSNKLDETAFYIPIVIEQYASGNIPCINAEIENQKLLLAIDLGFSGESATYNECLSKIKEKEFLTSTIVYGVSGKKYEEDVYRIPKMKVGRLTFSNLVVSSENPEFINDSAINIKNDDTTRIRSGRVGWRLFNRCSLLLDLGKSTIAVCDNIETFLKQGFSLKNFTKVPMLDGGEHVEFHAITPKGPLRCILDTGCTFNVLKGENPKNERLEDVINKKRSLKKFASFQVEGTDFGPINFYCLPINLPPGVDAILGMDFLIDHIVFIDFNNRQIYFSKN